MYTNQTQRDEADLVILEIIKGGVNSLNKIATFIWRKKSPYPFFDSSTGYGTLLTRVQSALLRLKKKGAIEKPDRKTGWKAR